MICSISIFISHNSCSKRPDHLRGYSDCDFYHATQTVSNFESRSLSSPLTSRCGALEVANSEVSQRISRGVSDADSGPTEVSSTALVQLNSGRQVFGRTLSRWNFALNLLTKIHIAVPVVVAEIIIYHLSRFVCFKTSRSLSTHSEHTQHRPQ